MGGGVADLAGAVRDRALVAVAIIPGVDVDHGGVEHVGVDGADRWWTGWNGELHGEDSSSRAW